MTRSCSPVAPEKIAAKTRKNGHRQREAHRQRAAIAHEVEQHRAEDDAAHASSSRPATRKKTPRSPGSRRRTSATGTPAVAEAPAERRERVEAPRRAARTTSARVAPGGEALGRESGARRVVARLGGERARAARGARRRPVHELRERALGANAAVDEDADAVGQLRRLVEVVGREQDRHAARTQLAQQLVDPLARGGVDADRRLVEQQHVGPVQRAGGEVDAPLHARPRAWRPGSSARSARPVQRESLGDGGPDLAARQAREAREQREVLAHRQVGVEGDLLRHQPEPPAQAAVAARVAAGSRTSPASSRRRPQIARTRLVLPAPFGPSSA